MIFVITPIIGASLPALTPIIFAAAAALGYKALLEMPEGDAINRELRRRIHEEQDVELRLEDSVLEAMDLEVKRAESLFFQKEGFVLVVAKDERGKLRIKVTGPKARSSKELRAAGEEFAAELAQLYAQHRAVEELTRLNAEVIEEQVNDQGEIVLKIRRWT